MAKENYRRIYEQNFGAIPKDNQNRSYEIHHIDGNPKNNQINNLKCVSIQEHYDIHYSQKDWGACYLIGKKLKLSAEELSLIASKAASKMNQDRVADGSHPFLGGKIQKKTNKIRLQEGSHNFLQKDFQKNLANERVKKGTHHFLSGEIQKKACDKKVADGTHHFLKKDFQKNVQKRLLEEGRHQSQITYTCPHCGKFGKGNAMKFYHFDNCKDKK